jgi:uncharacterized protein YdhG (YjbR/CyaY superfamily)
MKEYNNIDQYISVFPENIQIKLQEIREVIKKSAPEAIETINYQMPTFKLNGNLVHFAAYKNHIGFYPGPRAIEVFKEKLSKYKTTKGTIQFRLDEPIPFEIIDEIVKFRVSNSK